uniref:Uncharacterized protein n=1 Tax=Gorilla gorilla gorilla TaxID=9595 RepID=A0A2I2YVX3_GORGO
GSGYLASFNLSHSVSEALAWSARGPPRPRGWWVGGLWRDRGSEERAGSFLSPVASSGSACPEAASWAAPSASNPAPDALRTAVPASGRRGPGAPGEKSRRAASARPLRTQAQADPHGLLALAAAAAGARLREEPLRGGRRAEAAGRQSQPLRDAGEGVVPEPEDKVQTAEAGGGRA